MSARLTCPWCRAALTLDAAGANCCEHGRFPYRDGVLSFLPRDAAAFEEHWDTTVGAPLPRKKMAVAKRFLHPLLQNAAWTSALDLGCGDGVHLAVLRDAAPQADLIGLDVSRTALRSARGHVERWLPLHAEAERIPLANECVDAGFAFGVLAYLAAPWLGLAELVRVVKPGGLIGVWFYPDRDDIPGRAFKFTRHVVTRLPRFAQMRIADLIVPFLGVLPTASGLTLRHASWTACREVVLVNLAPAQLIFATADEIKARLRALDCEIVAYDADLPHTVWAKKG